MGKVELKNVSKTYSGNIEVVKDANLEILDKEFMVLVGPSGCGKSTTLRMLAGLEEITDGEILIDDTVVNDLPPKHRDIAMVFQNYALYPHMTVYDNMAYGLKMRKYSKDQIDKEVRKAAEILGITEYLSRKPKALSGGQRQRVAVGRAIVRQPKVFLFDEPLSNLDAKMRVQMRAEISRLHQRLNKTVVYVTHDQIEAMTMGSRICVMKDGVIQQVDTPLNIFHNPINKFVAGFIGGPPMNFFEGAVEIQNDVMCFNEGNFTTVIDEKDHAALNSYIGKKVTFGIRPSDILTEESGLPKEVGFSCNADVVEQMGDELFVYVTLGETDLVIKLTGNYDIAVNSTFSGRFYMKKACFFDMETTNRIF